MIYVVCKGKKRKQRPYAEISFFMKKSTAESYAHRYKKECKDDSVFWVDTVDE